MDLENENLDDVIPAPSAGIEDHVEDQPAAKAEGSDDTPAPSTGEEDDKKSLLDIVQDALPDRVKDEEGTPSTPEQNTEPDQNQAEDATSDDGAEGEDEVPDEQLPFHKHKRFQQLIKERNELKTAAEASASDLADYAKIRKFQEDAGLSSDEVAEGYTVMSMLKNNPAEAYKNLKPIVDQLAVLVGDAIPSDLQTQVDDGSIDADSAARIAKAEGAAELQKQALERDQLRRQQMAEHRAQQDMVSAVSAWEAEVTKTDSDFAKKRTMVREQILSLQRQGEVPKSSADAVALAAKALKQVDEYIAQFVPASAPTVVPPVSQQPSSPTGRIAPKGEPSMREVALQALEQTRAGSA